MNDFLIKRIEPKEYDFIFDLNKANEELLLPLDEEKLDFFSQNAELFLIVYADGVPAGFLIALREGLEEKDRTASMTEIKAERKPRLYLCLLQ